MNALSLLATMARQLHDVRQRLELRNVRSARERVSLYLELRAGPGGAVRVEGELQDIAADLGLTREVLYRTLAVLETSGLIERRDREILLKKSPAA
jgi:CRP-like cAMP-binding protein